MNVFFTGSSSGYACDDGPTDGRCQMANVKLEGEFIVIDDGGTNVAIPLGTSATDWEAIARKYTDVAGSGKGCCAAETHTALEIRTFKTTVLAKLQCMYPQHHVEADTINVVRPGDHFAVHSGTAGCKHHSNLTAVLFLNWDFGGGSLEFPNIGYRHRPVKGQHNLITFPPHMQHAVRPVTAGFRVTLTFNMYEKPIACTARLPVPKSARFDQDAVDSVRKLFAGKCNVVCGRDSVYRSILTRALGPPRKVYCLRAYPQSLCFRRCCCGELSNPIAPVEWVVGDMGSDFGEHLPVLLLFKEDGSSLAENDKTSVEAVMEQLDEEEWGAPDNTAASETDDGAGPDDEGSDPGGYLKPITVRITRR